MTFVIAMTFVTVMLSLMKNEQLSPVTRALLRAKLTISLSPATDDKLLAVASVLGVDAYEIDAWGRSANGLLDPIQRAVIARRADPTYEPCPKCRKSPHGCWFCLWYGVVLKGEQRCDHALVHVAKVGSSLNEYQCRKCGEISTIDSSG